MTESGPGKHEQQIYRHRFLEEDRRRKAVIWKVLVEGFFRKWIPGDGTVLDLGCGYGEFLNHVRCARRVGVDLNPDSRDFLDQGIEFHQASLSRLDFLSDDSFDVVFISNVLEHLASKPEVEATLKESRRALKRGGTLIVMGPNSRFTGGAYWDFWDHHVPITDRSLVEVLQLLDFQVLDCIPRFLPYTTRSRMPQRPTLVKMYLRCSWAWKVFGSQYLVRARKV